MTDDPLEIAAEAVGRLGDKCLELNEQRRWLLEALEAHSTALAAVLAAVRDDGDDELRTRVGNAVRAILSERADFSDETIDRVFPGGS